MMKQMQYRRGEEWKKTDFSRVHAGNCSDDASKHKIGAEFYKVIVSIGEKESTKFMDI